MRFLKDLQERGVREREKEREEMRIKSIALVSVVSGIELVLSCMQSCALLLSHISKPQEHQFY